MKSPKVDATSSGNFSCMPSHVTIPSCLSDFMLQSRHTSLAAFLRLDMFIDDELPEDESHTESTWQDVVGGAVDPEVACLREVGLLAPSSDHGDRAVIGGEPCYILWR